MASNILTHEDLIPGRIYCTTHSSHGAKHLYLGNIYRAKLEIEVDSTYQTTDEHPRPVFLHWRSVYDDFIKDGMNWNQILRVLIRLHQKQFEQDLIIESKDPKRRPKLVREVKILFDPAKTIPEVITTDWAESKALWTMADGYILTNQGALNARYRRHIILKPWPEKTTNTHHESDIEYIANVTQSIHPKLKRICELGQALPNSVLPDNEKAKLNPYDMKSICAALDIIWANDEIFKDDIATDATATIMQTLYNTCREEVINMAYITVQTLAVKYPSQTRFLIRIYNAISDIEHDRPLSTLDQLRHIHEVIDTDPKKYLKRPTDDMIRNIRSTLTNAEQLLENIQK